MPTTVNAFLFDFDGTPVDTVYQHDLAWQSALEAEGIELSARRIHRRIGMSGGLLANMLLRATGLDLNASRMNRLRELHTSISSQLQSEVSWVRQ